MSKELLLKVVEGIADRQMQVFDVVYFYGDRKNICKLLQTVEEKFRENHPHAEILRTNAAVFRKETYQNILEGILSIPECDLFIFEDIGEIAGLEANEQRLYGILDWLLENKRQIVMSGTSPVADMTTLSSRICAQIDGGISFEVGPAGEAPYR